MDGAARIEFGLVGNGEESGAASLVCEIERLKLMGLG
jgi:hypothetical protein